MFAQLHAVLIAKKNTLTELWKQGLNSKLLKGGFLVFLFILGARIVQFVKELFVAKEIGLTAELDAFIMALLILFFSTNFLLRPFGYALIPIFIRLKQYALPKANLLFTKVLVIALVVGLLCTFLNLFFIDIFLPLLVGNFSESHQQLTKEILFYLTPYYFFDLIGSLFGVYLNTQNKNFLYSTFEAFPALFTILFFIFFTLDQPIYQQVYGFNVGSFFVLCLLIYSAYKNGYRPRFNFKLDKTLKICIAQWLPLIFSALLLSINLIVDKKMAADLGVGSVSHLEYGAKLFSIFSGFAITGITIIIYPFYSEKIAKKDFEGILKFLKITVRNIILPLIIGTALVIYYSEDIVRILFERGAFQATETKIVAEIMTYYMIAFPVMLLGIIGVRLINALQLNKLVFYFSVVNLVLNIGLNILFIEWIGLKGVALSSSIVLLMNALLMWASIVCFFKKKKIA